MLEVRNVVLHYGAALALRDVSLTAAVGEVTCLLGRNGVGKTSLLRAITGAHPVSEGSIVWEGTDITRMPTHERARRGIASVPQGRDIFPLLTVRENLETGFAVLPRQDRHTDGRDRDSLRDLARQGLRDRLDHHGEGTRVRHGARVVLDRLPRPLLAALRAD